MAGSSCVSVFEPPRRAASRNLFKIESISSLNMVLLPFTHRKLYLSYDHLSFFEEKSELAMHFWSDENPSREPICDRSAL